MININMLRDEDNDAGFITWACASDPIASYGGAKLFRSIDGGSTYAHLVDVPNEATMGYATTALGDFAGGNIVDESNSVNVVLTNGSLSSVTYDGLLAGVNMALLGEEILFFRDATLQGNGSYTLTGLLRGRRGSEYAMAGHAVADRFVLVSLSTLERVPQVLADIGIERNYKMVAVGKTVAGATAKLFTNSGCGLKPYALVHLGGGRNADDDVILTWVRRGRIDGSWRDLVDVPLSEASEAYEVEIYDDSGYTTVLRTITGITSQTTTYLAATQTSDGLTPGDPVYFKVYQLSGSVGRGHAASGSV